MVGAPTVAVMTTRRRPFVRRTDHAALRAATARPESAWLDADGQPISGDVSAGYTAALTVGV